MPDLTRHHLQRAARDLAQCYRDLASELVTSASALERASRPHSDSYPVVSMATFAETMKRGAVLHFILDEIQREK